MNDPWEPRATTPQARRRHADPTAAADPPTGGLPTADDPEGDYDDVVIRPFLLTGGRTRPAQEGLNVETLLQATPGALTPGLRFEARQIVEACQMATSLAELAAALQVPIGVARVLVSDLIAEGFVTMVERGELSVQLLERIRDRVRAL
jgi:Protein of unknown function (DUF742)